MKFIPVKPGFWAALQMLPGRGNGELIMWCRTKKNVS